MVSFTTRLIKLHILDLDYRELIGHLNEGQLSQKGGDNDIAYNIGEVFSHGLLNLIMDLAAPQTGLSHFLR